MDIGRAHEMGPAAGMAARQAVRTLKRTRALTGASGLPAGGVTVWLCAGAYPLRKTFALTAEGSGTADAPTVYLARQKAGVRLTGGV